MSGVPIECMSGVPIMYAYVCVRVCVRAGTIESVCECVHAYAYVCAPVWLYAWVNVRMGMYVCI